MNSDEASGWELWRQDDNGNRFLIGRFASPDAAEGEQRRFEALAHKQTYWVQSAADVGATDANEGASPGGSDPSPGALG